MRQKKGGGQRKTLKCCFVLDLCLMVNAMEFAPLALNNPGDNPNLSL